MMVEEQVSIDEIDNENFYEVKDVPPDQRNCDEDSVRSKQSITNGENNTVGILI